MELNSRDAAEMTEMSEMSEMYLTEFKYHRKVNTWLVFLALPFFIFFTIFTYTVQNYLQSLIFSMMSLNALITQYLAYRYTRVDDILRLKQVGGTIAFGLLAGSLVAVLFSKDIYTGFPWLPIYPVAAMLFFGGLIGVFSASIFCAAAISAIFIIDMPAWSDSAVTMFKLSSSFCLITIFGIAVITEKTRLRMRNNLMEARNKYKEAEERQRRTNEELKSEIEMRVKSEKALAESETRYRTLFEESTVSLWEENFSKVKAFLDDLPLEAANDLGTYLKQNPDEIKRCMNLIRVTGVNRATLNLYKTDSLRNLLKNIRQVLPIEGVSWMAERLASLYRNGRYNAQMRSRNLEGANLHLLVDSTVPAEYEGSWEKVFTSVYDITDRVVAEKEKTRVEQQLQQARQLQAVSTLAGGIAHQINNALAVICGTLDLLELDIGGEANSLKHVDSLRSSSERMRRLTEQLLAYAQGGKYQPMDFPINNLLRGLLKSNPISRETAIQVAMQFENDLYLAGSDSTQIRIVMEAVLANAAEATRGSGEIRIATRHVKLDGRMPKGPESDLPAGEYVVISVEDDGVGMDEETRQRIFEPFFTTKFVGRGLGMAAAYGIVRNHDGLIHVESEIEKGSRVIIYLPGVKKTDKRSG